MKIKVQNTVRGLVPLTDEDYDDKRKLKIGEIYEVTVRQVRNYQFHKKYFALINLSWEYLNEEQQKFFKTKEVFRKSLEITAGHCDVVYSFETKSYHHTPKSISFEKMKEDEFSELYERVKDVLFIAILKNITEEEFTRELINF